MAVRDMPLVLLLLCAMRRVRAVTLVPAVPRVGVHSRAWET